MKKYLLLLITILGCFSQVNASHVAGAEITYSWLHDSTFVIYYHFYRDCKGIPEPTTVDICYQASSSCGLFTSSGTVTLSKLITISPGIDNGSELSTSCPGRPTTCVSDTSTIPGYREWWYQNTVTLPGSCDSWTFSHSEGSRNNGVVNLVSSSSTNLYVEAILNNKDAPYNSSPIFTVKPVPYICNNVPYTFNNGAFDPNNDSLDFECIHPLTGSVGCGLPPDTIPYATGYYLPSNPLPCGNTFVFNNQTGQTSFTPNAIGPSVLTYRINERRNIGGTWKKIGSVMRDMQLIVRPCNTPTPTVSTVPSTITGGVLLGGNIIICASSALNFCYDSKAGATGHILTVKDNHSIFSGTSSVSYTGMYTDSVRGCFSWIPSRLDSGLKIYTITVTDSNCSGIGIPISSTTAIPIYVSPVTHIQLAGTNTICAGDSVFFSVSGGGNFVWDVLPGGSPVSSLSCTSCKNTIAKPGVTTSYIAHSTNPLFCSKNTDTFKIYVLPSGAVPSVTINMKPAILKLFTNDTFKAVATNCGSSPTYTWYRNNNVLVGDTTNTYIAFFPVNIKYGDVIKVKVKAGTALPCVALDSATASTYPLGISTFSGNNNAALYPNPNEGSFTVNVQFNSTAITYAGIEILNSVGQIVYTDKAVVENRLLNKKIQLPPGLSRGIYMVHIKQEDESYVLRLDLQ